ncbi:MAG: hypothetical protein LBI44_08605 [Oscillospiraceae bacterium]|jgi:uncharacterized Zn finger protein (UPF0148 family)|nr:hypothetical protein [Oscillospiraceae bacterium]
MNAQVTNYTCPNCLGTLRFGSGSGKIECDHCGTTFELSVIEQLYADKEEAAASAGTEPRWDLTHTEGFTEEEAQTMKGYTCPSCLAALICHSTTAATSCPYCGNPTVVPGQLSGELKPDYVIPFKHDKTAAEKALAGYYKGKKFLPRGFASTSHIEEVKGVYTPFWLFDANTDAYIRYKAKQERTYRQGDYEITETKHYRVTREGSVAFQKVPADGSKNIPDAHMDSVEPFKYEELKPFSTAYLPGFMAEKYDEDAAAVAPRVNTRIKTSTERKFAETVKGYTSFSVEHSTINLQENAVYYSLMPIWLLTSRWKGANYLFAVNGQTGKLAGDLPVSRGKFWAWFFALFLIVSAVLAPVLYLLAGDMFFIIGGMVFALLFALILCLIWRGQMKTAVTARAADNYIPPGGFKLRNSDDKYLYTSTTKRKVNTANTAKG